MKKISYTLFTILFVTTIIGATFFFMLPQKISRSDVAAGEFSAKRALAHVSEIAKVPHYVGSSGHQITSKYIKDHLIEMGLQPITQQGTTLSDWGNLVKSENIMVRIEGSDNTKALVLLSHYDSAPHSSSHGASDNAVGVATILEGMRTFLHNKTPHKNDIIILFSDAEELGLNGAALFVTQSGWANEAGLVLNFEARGTAGPSYMLMEVNGGNAQMVKNFADASPSYSVANSLMYSIYKMLPNDTDLTVFREQGDIPGYNFAFIDDHFNYHTAQDDIDHLDHRSLAHQGTYLMPLLQHLSNTDLNKLNSEDDRLYFSVPFAFIHYPFSWIYPLLIAAAVLLLFLVFIGIGKRNLIPAQIGRGFINLILSVAVCGILGFFMWKAMLIAYPQYRDILHGFTYNGHWYIFGFCFLAISICFLFYSKLSTEIEVMSHSVAPLTLWMLINLAIAIYLPGAAFLIIPVFAMLIMFGFFILTQRSNSLLNLILSIPCLIIVVPFIWMFPIGLGLKILFGSMILTALTFGLLLPIVGAFRGKMIIAALSFIFSIGFFIKAHVNSDYTDGKGKPNSLVYMYDADTKKALFGTYDLTVDSWTKKYLGGNPKDATELNRLPLFSKYNSGFTFSANAPTIELADPTIVFTRDSIIGNQRHLKIIITPNRPVNRYDIFADTTLTIHNLRANGATPLGQKGSAYQRKGPKILSYYVVDDEPLEISFSINKNSPVNLQLLESSFDLLQNKDLNIAGRSNAMIPKPFVLNDAVIIRKSIKPTPILAPPAAAVPITFEPRSQVEIAEPIIDTIETEN